MSVTSLSTSQPIVFHPSKEERLAALRAAGQRVNKHGNRHLWFRLVAWLLIIGLIFAVFQKIDLGVPGGKFLPLMLLIFMSVYVAYHKRTQILREIVERQIDEFSLLLTSEGINISHREGEHQLAWSSVDAIELDKDVLLFHLRAFDVLTLPLRDLPEGVGADEFVAQVENLSGLPVKPKGSGVSDKFYISDKRPWRDWLDNLLAGLWFFVSPKRALPKLRISASQLVALFATSFLLTLLGEWLITGISSDFNPAGLPGVLIYIPLVLFVAWLSAKVVGDETLMLKAAVALVCVDVTGTIALYILLVVPQFWLDKPFTMFFGIAFWVLYAWIITAQAMALIWSQNIRLIEQRVVSVFAMLLFLIYPLWGFSQLYVNQLWTEPYDSSEYSAWQEKRQRVANEAVIYAQPALLQSALEAIPQGREGVPEFYAVSMGGYGKQDVFLREVSKTDKLFHERFDARGHVILVNNPETIQTHSMATMTALKRTLKVIGERMNAEEDVLLLFMTSHGASDFDFSLNLWPYNFDPLTPDTLKAALDDADIRYRAIVISACYSGGFVEQMSQPDTLIMSASRADRNSHGCSHEAEWTFFGQALFAEALNQTYSLETAFEIAQETVAKREVKEGYKASEPQISVGESVRPVLLAIEQRLEQNALSASQIVSVPAN